MKGIAPVVATILMLLIVIAIIGFAYTFFSGIIGTAGEQTEEQLRATVSQMSKGIWIDSASGSTVIVRDLGTENINTSATGSEVTVMVNGSTVTCTWVPVDPIKAGFTSTCTLSSPCNTGSEVSVSGPSNTATKTCS